VKVLIQRTWDIQIEVTSSSPYNAADLNDLFVKTGFQSTLWSYRSESGLTQTATALSSTHNVKRFRTGSDPTNTVALILRVARRHVPDAVVVSRWRDITPDAWTVVFQNQAVEAAEPVAAKRLEEWERTFLRELIALAAEHYPDLNTETHKAQGADMFHAARFLGKMES